VSIMGSARQLGYDTILSHAVSVFLRIRLCSHSRCASPMTRIEWSGPRTDYSLSGAAKFVGVVSHSVFAQGAPLFIGEQAKWFKVRVSKRLY
jgi:hypothetical protein